MTLPVNALANSGEFHGIAGALAFQYVGHMVRLTKQEQLVLCVVFGLLLVGWAVKAYRMAHPPASVEQVNK